MTNGPTKISSESPLLLFGSLTAVLLLAVLLNGLRSNLRSELGESSHRVGEVALNVAQMLRAPLRASADAMTFIAEESERLQHTVPQHSEALLKDIVAQTLRRQPQIVGIAFTSAAPGATSAANDSAGSVWTSCDTYIPAVARTVCFGAMAKTPRGWMLPLAVPLEGGRWVVGDIQLAALRRTVANAPHAGDISFEVVDARGQQIVQGGHPTAAAAAAHPPDEPGWIGRLFGVHTPVPLQASASVGLYPFRVNAGMTYQTALAPWHRQLWTATSFYFLYLSAFVYLLRTVARNAGMQRYYIQRLQAKTRELHTAQRVGRTAIWTLYAHAPYFECSDEAEEIFGLPAGKTTASVKEFLALVLPLDRLALIRQVKAAWRDHGRLHAEFHIKRSDGAVRRLSAGGQVVVDKADMPRMTGTVVDVTEQWEARQQQAESEHRFRSLFEHNPLPFWVFDAETLRFLEVNAAATQLYGYTREEFLAMTILDIRDPEDRPDVLADVALPRETRQSSKIWIHKTKEGKTIDVRIHSADIVFNGRAARLILAEDVTTHLAGERELAYRASHDLTTRLPNQRTLMAWVDVLIAEEATFEIAYIQLLGMDAIADTFGIHVASGILQSVAARLSALTGDSECLATVNHEAFVLATASGPLTADRLQALGNSVTEPLYYEDTQHQIDLVIGVAGHPRDGVQSNVLVARAALAAHAHLQSDRPIHYFEPSLAHKSKEKLHFAASLRRAVKHHEFELHFQPITNFPDMRLMGLEALIRWPQKDGTTILPSSFIPLCEESGLIVPLGQWVLNQVAKVSRELREAGFDHLPIGVNISPAELRSSDLVENLRAVRDAYSLADDAIHIELTESSLIEHRDKAIAVMRQLRQDGFAVALDDFGTGFSSLSYLHDLPIDILKIDQAFIRHVDRDARSALICEAIIALGKSLKVRVIAEGIERPSQYRWLHQHGCDGAQGFYLSKPQRLAEFLRQWTPARERAH